MGEAVEGEVSSQQEPGYRGRHPEVLEMVGLTPLHLFSNNIPSLFAKYD